MLDSHENIVATHLNVCPLSLLFFSLRAARCHGGVVVGVPGDQVLLNSLY